MKVLKKLILFLAFFYLSTQGLIYFFLPNSFIYNNRLNYDVFKDNVYTIETTVKAIKSIIDKEKVEDYIIF